MPTLLGLLAGAGVLSSQTPLTWVTAAQLPVALRGVSYSTALSATGGTAPRTFSLVGGTLPAGLQLIAAGEIRGTPTQTGVSSFTLRVTDTCSGSGCVPRTADRTFSLTVSIQGITFTTDSLAAASGCASYSQTMAATGGTLPYTWSATGMPQGLTINPASGVISGTPAPGSYTLVITVRDSANQSTTRGYTLSVTGSALQITTAALPNGIVATAYSAALQASGGVAPYTFAVMEQPVPGLVTASSGVITGTPSQAGTFSTLYRVTDSGGCTSTQRLPVQIAVQQPASNPLTMTFLGLPGARADVPYSATLGATGGTPPYVWALAGGELPAGIELTPEGILAGTTSSRGVFPLLLRVTDSAQRSVVRQFGLAVNPPIGIETSTLPPARVGSPYSATLVSTGGIGGLVWTVTAGALPAGMQLGLFNGIISGTPVTAGDYTFEVAIKDGENYTVTKPLALTVGDILLITTDRLPAGKIGQPYTATVTATGGVAPLEFEAAGLPPGLAMDASGAVSGTPTTSGAWVMTVKVTDATKGTFVKSVVISVDTVFRVLTESLASGQAGSVYNEVLTAVDGKPPYRWTAPPRSLPLGVSLGEYTGQLTGTPVEPGEHSIAFKVFDSANATAERTLTISIANGFRITTETLPAANVNVLYSAGLQTAGARTPISWGIASGTLPTGFTIDPSTGIISGRTANKGEYAFAIRATDATFAEATRELKIMVRDVLRLDPGSLPNAEAGIAYQQKIAALDAQGSLTWTLLSGIVPEGLRLEFSPDGANVTGTPVKPGTYQFSLQARDTAGQTVTQPFAIRVLASVNITTDTLKSAFVGVAYTVALTAEGGEPGGGGGGYTWSLGSGPLPAGLALDAVRGVIAGSPTESGTFTFTLEARDAKGRLASKTLSIRVIRDLTPTLESLSGATVGMRYTQTLRAVVPEVSWLVTEGRLPDGLVLNGASGEIRGIPAREGTFSFTAEARDVSGASGSRQYTIVVARLDLPRFTIDPTVAQPAHQVPILVTLAAPAPSDLSGTLTVRFQPDGGPDDPAVRLSTGRVAAFTIAQGAAQPSFTGGPAMLQTGTTSGTITLEIALASNGVAVTPNPAPVRTIRIPRSAPVLNTVTARRVGPTLNLDLTGYATNREVTAAEFQFSGGLSFTVSLQAVLAEWYRGAASQNFGSQFNITIPFVSISSPAVTVTLINSLGRSQPVMLSRLP